MNKNFINLSVNLNKIALIRNSRPGNNPNLIDYVKKIIGLGANGITVHPRPDQRHIRPEDCQEISSLIKNILLAEPTKKKVEFNIEGNPFASSFPKTRPDFSDYPGFINILESYKPDQATLVPDNNQQLTSDHGFDLSGDTSNLEAVISDIKKIGCRVSLFMDTDIDQISKAKEIGADRIEIYTGPFAEAFDINNFDSIFEKHCVASEHAKRIGLGVNAGHDLNLKNLLVYRNLPFLEEVSIGHALTIDSLNYGLDETIKKYIEVLNYC